MKEQKDYHQNVKKTWAIDITLRRTFDGTKVETILIKRLGGLMQVWHLGYDITKNHWDYVDADTEAEAIEILKRRVSDDEQIPESQIEVHAIYRGED